MTTYQHILIISGHGECQGDPVPAHVPRHLPEEVALHAGQLPHVPREALPGQSTGQGCVGKDDISTGSIETYSPLCQRYLHAV